MRIVKLDTVKLHRIIDGDTSHRKLIKNDVVGFSLSDGRSFIMEQ
jgi:hypothetical protein